MANGSWIPWSSMVIDMMLLYRYVGLVNIVWDYGVFCVNSGELTRILRQTGIGHRINHTTQIKGYKQS